MSARPARASRLPGPRTWRSSAPDLSFERHRCHGSAMQSDSVAHVAIDDDRTALDHADRNPAVNLALDFVELYDVEHECLPRLGGMAADSNPLVDVALLHDDVGKDLERAIHR